MLHLWRPVPLYQHLLRARGLPWWLSGKEPTCRCRRCRFNPWVKKIPWRGGHGNPLEYSCQVALVVKNPPANAGDTGDAGSTHGLGSCVPKSRPTLCDPMDCSPPGSSVQGLGFPGGSDGKESACNVGDLGSIPGSGRSPGEGNTHSSILA